MNITSRNRKYDEDIIAKRIKLVEKYLGESSDPDCKHCEWSVTAIGRHAPECPLRKLDPMVVAGMLFEARDELIKNMNRQRIWRGEVKKFGRGGPVNKTACRKQKRPPKKPKEDLKLCRVCCEQRLFIHDVCQTCQHSRPCTWEWDEKPCPVCHVGKKQQKKYRR